MDDKTKQNANSKNGPKLLFIVSLWLIFLGCLASISIIVNNYISWPCETTHEMILTGFILLGCGSGLFFAVYDWYNSIFRSLNIHISQIAFYSLVSLAGCFLAFCIFDFGMRQFGGFDHSVLIDVGWRLVQGQKVHIDFPCTLPAGFFLGAKFAFQLFGVSWQSLILFTVFFSLITYAWIIWLLLQLINDRFLAFLLGLTIQSISLLLVSYWWYNPITSVSAAIFILSAALWWQRPADKASRFSYFCALFLIALMKPNTAGIIVPLISMIFLFSKQHRFRVLILSVFCFGLFVMFLWLNEVNLIALLHGYLSVAQRGATLQQFMQLLSPLEKKLAFTILAIVTLPALFSVCLGRVKWFSLHTWFALVGLIAGLEGFFTNGELKLVDLPLILISSYLLTSKSSQNAQNQRKVLLTLPDGWRRYFIAVCVILIFAGYGEGVTREKVRTIGPGVFFQHQFAEAPFPGIFFKGLLAGDRLHETYKQVEELLQKEPNSSVMFGPRMQWAYAAFRRQSPQNLPVWWHPGVSFAPDNEGLYVSRIMDRKFDLIILFKNDATYFSQYFIQRLAQNYIVDQSYSQLTVLRRIRV